jgi:hypothetical protein
MKQWLIGDLHVHSVHDGDGHLSVEETVKRSKQFCDFIAIAGHARNSDNWGVEQYEAILETRRNHPEFFLFHTGEWEFPIERHTIVLTTPDNRDFELQKELVRRFDRRRGVEGRGKAVEALQYIEENWGDQALMIFNHPDSPPVSMGDLAAIAPSPVFKIIACYDRGERRARQTWDVAAEWDQLLMKGHRIWVRFGSDFHQHFTDGHSDYYPGEFVQDQLFVDEKSYRGIFDAYKNGTYFCTVDNIISELRMEITDGFKVSFTCNEPITHVEIIGDGQVLKTVTEVDQIFSKTIDLPPASYYRLRGHGIEKKRRYDEGRYVPVFMSQPVFF